MFAIRSPGRSAKASPDSAADDRAEVFGRPRRELWARIYRQEPIRLVVSWHATRAVEYIGVLRAVSFMVALIQGSHGVAHRGERARGGV